MLIKSDACICVKMLFTILRYAIWMTNRLAPPKEVSRLIGILVVAFFCKQFPSLLCMAFFVEGHGIIYRFFGKC